jgi:hypothetical protein
MQGFAQASENPPAQEQWKTMKKQCAETIGTIGKSGRVLTSGWTPEDRATALRASPRQVECDGPASS